MYLGVKWRQIESFWTTAHPCNKQPHVNNLQIQNQMCVHTHCGNPNSDAFIGKLHSSSTFLRIAEEEQCFCLYSNPEGPPTIPTRILSLFFACHDLDQKQPVIGASPKHLGPTLFFLSGLAKIWNWIFIVLMSQQPSNTFRGGSPHSWLVNTCSWHWLLKLLPPSRDILLNRHQSPRVEDWGSLESKPTQRQQG